MVASYMTDEELTPVELAARYGYYCGVRGTEIVIFDDTPAEMGFFMQNRTYSWDEMDMAKIRSLFDGEKVAWQTGELGKVDEGGGGTVAKYVANLGVEVVDVGVPVLSMHAPFEIVAKLDVYMAFKGFKAFLEQ